MRTKLPLLLISVAALAMVSAFQVVVAHETVKPAFAYAIPNVPGKTVTALVVTYKPGGTSQSHRHGQAFVIAYVLTGAIRSQLEGGKAQIYHAGESWIEAPGAHHLVSDNASKTEPASLLAIFVADSSDKKLVTYDKP
jgi:quercetin dioxygenase-like cupin family protein